MLPLELAALTESEQAHEQRVLNYVQAQLQRAGGWLPFEDFMAAVLYAPGLGYYAAGAHKIGHGGDFITAPEISPVFGRCVARECVNVIKTLGGGNLLELGAGTGELAAEILSSMARDGGLPDRYWILEISPDLRERQRQRLSQLPKALFDRVEWLDRLPDAPWNGVLLANEVLDALPVARVRGEPSGLSELGVASHGRRPVEEARPARPALLQQWRQREVALAPGQEAEFCPGLRGWLDGVTAQLHAGVALFLDYGESRRHLYSAARPRGTLVAFHRHRIHNDPFVHLGLQDLTAWVDFTAVAEAALAAGLDVAGFTNQTCFLLGNGFEQHLCDWRESLDEESSLLAARTALKLVLPDDMGERFKCMALTRNYEGALGGFALRDFTDSL